MKAKLAIALLTFAGSVTAAVPQPISAGGAVTPETAKVACKQMNATGRRTYANRNQP
jgi:hypothetical protein